MLRLVRQSGHFFTPRSSYAPSDDCVRRTLGFTCKGAPFWPRALVRCKPLFGGFNPPRRPLLVRSVSRALQHRTASVLPEGRPMRATQRGVRQRPCPR